jgi:hypothetical protein
VKSGELPACKYGVRIQRFAGGCSIDVTVKGYGPVYSPDWFENGGSRYMDDANAFLKSLEGLANQWNFDGSEPESDYFHVNYYCHVDFDGDETHAEYLVGIATK